MFLLELNLGVSEVLVVQLIRSCCFSYSRIVLISVQAGSMYIILFTVPFNSKFRWCAAVWKLMSEQMLGLYIASGLGVGFDHKNSLCNRKLRSIVIPTAMNE